ncbi:hypothetical protein BH18VER1_BH18VER1_07400 [soil metagenome]
MRNHEHERESREQRNACAFQAGAAADGTNPRPETRGQPVRGPRAADKSRRRPRHDPTAFWQTYLEQFREVQSEFTNDFATDRTAVLEWNSRGKLADGRPIGYRGVSIIEFGDNGLTSFRTYYDSALFVRAGV